MRASSFGYLVKQGVKNVFINRMMSAACIGVMTACMLLIGFAMLVSSNITEMLTYVEGQNELVAFVRDSVAEEDYEILEDRITALGNIKTITFVSKEEALASERESFGEMASLLDGLEEDNPLPASFRITLKDLSKLDETLAELKNITELEEINAPMELSLTITTLEKAVFYAGLTVVVVLLLVSLIIISNTVRLTVHSHRREIGIMKSCGATNTYIRLPFLVEGTIVGLFAAVLSYAIVYVLYERMVFWLISRGGETGFLSSILDELLPFTALAIPLGVVFLAFGCLVGLLGSFLFVRKYLKV